MPLTIVPDAGDVLMCQFDGSPPEMTKLRRVIVLTPRNRAYFPDTFLVVPVSKDTACAPGFTSLGIQTASLRLF